MVTCTNGLFSIVDLGKTPILPPFPSPQFIYFICKYQVIQIILLSMTEAAFLTQCLSDMFGVTFLNFELKLWELVYHFWRSVGWGNLTQGRRET